MAGSIRYFRYTADDGTTWALQADESNIEAINTGADLIITPGQKYKVPPNLEPRHAIFQSADGRVRRKIVVLSTGTYGPLSATTSFVDPVSELTVTLKRKVGEVVSLPSLADTAINDGDAD